MLFVQTRAPGGLFHAWPITWRFFTSQSLQSTAATCWQVSSHGRLCNTRGIISHGSLASTGYRTVSMFGQSHLVHRVVKITFHGLTKSAEAWQVHHVDGNKANNRLDNLEYVTPSANVQHSFCRLERCTSGPAQSKPVMWRHVGSTSWTACPSADAAAYQLRMHPKTVSRYCRKNSAAQICDSGYFAVKGFELRYQGASELCFPGEEWRVMVDPRSGVLVRGRMVSSLGRVTLGTGLVTRGHHTQAGYYTTWVYNQNVFVHRLVAFAFLGPPPTDHQTVVNHKDLDKGNNEMDNLEWVSTAENQVHAILHGSRQPRSDAKPVYSRPINSNIDWIRHRSILSAARALGLHMRCVSRCAWGLQKRTGNYEFRFADASEAASLPGEEWREVDWLALQRDKEERRRH